MILKGLKFETEELKDRIRQLEDELDVSQGQLATELEEKAKELKGKLDRAESDNVTLKEENQYLKDEVKSLEEEIKEVSSCLLIVYTPVFFTRNFYFCRASGFLKIYKNKAQSFLSCKFSIEFFSHLSLGQYSKVSEI